MTAKTRAEQIREQARRARVDVDPSAEAEHHRSHRPAVRVKPVRRTVDLPPAHHTKLDEWQVETARQLGLSRVTGQDVIRALVARLLTDETLARKIRKDLSEDVDRS